MKERHWYSELTHQAIAVKTMHNCALLLSCISLPKRMLCAVATGRLHLLVHEKKKKDSLWPSALRHVGIAKLSFLQHEK